MKNKIPTDSLAVCDGQTCIGFIIARGGSYLAFRPDGSLYGEFVSRAEAVRSLPAATPAPGANKNANR